MAGALIAARYHYAGTLLPNGKVLVAGGYGGTTTLSSAEVYDPSTDEWSTTGNLAAARILHTSTLLPSGKVLIVGGFGDGVGPLASAEVYDPAVNVLSATESLATARRTHTATLLPNDKVLAAGGFGGNALSSAELYVPGTKNWSAAASLAAVRNNHTATLLPNGKVLVTGGFNTSTLSSSEVYDAATLAWSPVGSLTTARYTHTATLLPNGRVLVAGGFNSGDLSSTEVYNAATQVWNPAASLATARRLHTATLLPNGKVLVAGGRNGGILTSAELYDPATNTWSAVGPLAVARYNHTATLLPSGKVLVAGGFNTGYVASAEVYDPATNAWSTVGSLGTARYLHTATLLPNGNVLVAGGYNGATLSSTEVYDPASKTWSAAGPLGSARRSHTTTLLPDGAVLLAGGDNAGMLSSAELFKYDLQFQLAWQPVIINTNSPINLLGVNHIVLGGTRFKGISEASCGNTNNSASNYPLLQVRRVDNEQISFVLPDPSSPYADDAFSSRSLNGFSPGVVLVTVITNGIPSESAILSIISNSAPTNISFTPADISENSPIGTMAGTLSTTDADTGDAFNYILVSGLGSTDNGSFSITGNTLFTVAILDFETKSSYGVRVRSTDANGLSIEKAFTVSVTNVAPDVPTDSNTAANSVAEGAANGSTVGITASSSDIHGGTITYSLTDNAGGRFAINGSSGVVSVANSALLDFETANSHTITISASDNLASVTATFTINVTNTNDTAPIIVSALQASPNPAITGDEVFFTVAAADVEGDALVTGYNYGDDSVGVAASHTYTAPGVYVVTVTVSDTVNAPATSSSILLVRSPSSPDVDFDGDGIPNAIDADDDGDGFDDEFELGAGSNPVSNTDTPLPGGMLAGEPAPLEISSFRLKLNFAKPGTDSITFRGTLNVPNGFSVGGQKIMLSVGGVNRLFALNAKGASPKANDMFKVSIKSKAGKVPAQAAKYQVKFSNGDFAAALSDEELNGTTVKGATRTIAVRAIFNNTYLQKMQTLRYSAVRSKWGKASTTR